MYLFKTFDQLQQKYVYVRIGTNQSGLDVMKCEKVQNMQDFTQTELNKCRDENLKLQAVVADLRQVNRRWQSYNGEMQKLIKRLHTTIEDQQEQLNNMADFQAQKLFHNSQDRDHTGEPGCTKCQPVIDFLKNRVRKAEEEVIILESHHGYSKHNAELVSLQLRLRQACQHIEHLNRIMVSKGILKSGYNVHPDITANHEVKPCSRDGMKLYECDDILNATILEGVCSRRNPLVCRSESPSTSWEDAREEAEGKFSSDKLFQDSLSTVSTQSSLDISHLHHSPNAFIGISSSNGSPIDNNVCKCVSREKNKSEYQNFKLPFDMLSSESSEQAEGSNSRAKLITSPIDFNPSVESSYNTLELIDSPVKADSSCTNQSKWWFDSDHKFHRSPVEEPYNWDHVRVVNSELPDICPHCQTSFPPDSKSRFNNHLMSCQYL